MLLITGANGQLGTELHKIFPDAMCSDINDFDISNEEEAKAYISDNKIKTVINCAAYTAIDDAEDNPDMCRKINTFGPATLASTGAKIIHLSTGYVFDGTNHKPYSTQDYPMPNSVYAKSKVAGEYAVLEGGESVIVIRTTWLYSTLNSGENFVRIIREEASKNKTLDVICDQVASPTYAGDLALAISRIIPQFKTGHKGLYHYTNEGVATWYDFAQEIVSQLKLDCKINPVFAKDKPRKAFRPYYCVLDKTKIKENFGVEIPYWKDSLKKCLSQLET